MSYILEALKKSEQERNPEQVPGLDTHHYHVSTEKKSKMPYWFLGIALLLINMVYIIYKMNQESMVVPSVEEGIMEQSVSAPVPADVKPELIKEKPVVEIIAKPKPRIVNRSLDRASLPDISELSASVQQQLPSIDFSTHIYIKDGGSFVIINGRSYGDGMTISQGLKIEKILADGIVLVFQEQYFFLGSLINWQ